jgi:hypothetical protein
MAIFSPLAGLLMDRSSRQLSEYVLLYSSVWALVCYVSSISSYLWNMQPHTHTYLSITVCN